MSCIIPGSPLIDEERAQVAAGGRLLQISRVQVANEGVYSCVCSNEAGSSQRDYLLEVYGKCQGTLHIVLSHNLPLFFHDLVSSGIHPVVSSA